MNIRATAPGKAIIAGEYAVLDGAPAISMAIGRRAAVILDEPGNGDPVVRMPGLREGEWRFRVRRTAAAMEWLDAPPRGGARLLEAAWQAIGGAALSARSLIIDTSEFCDAKTGSKLGFGSSAAAMTALVYALCEMPHAGKDAAMLAHDAHRKLQGGLGSGVDIATSCCGGLIAYRMKNAAQPRRLSWPHGLAYRFIWSGRPADTVSRISKLANESSKAPGRQSLARAAEQVVSAWDGAEPGAILGMLGRYTSALLQFSIDRDLGIFDAGHWGLADKARRDGLVYKPCGAGGGDIGIVMGNDEHAVRRFCRYAGEQGFWPLQDVLDNRGATTSVEAVA